MNIHLFNIITIEIKNQKRINKKNEWYKNDYKEFVRLLGANSEFSVSNNYPCLKDKNDDSGTINGAYFHQDLYVAKQIYKNNPQRHVDVGSRIDGFVAHVAVFRKIEIIDIRELNSKVENVIYNQADLTATDFKYNDYCDSISSLHALEHFGLGRYGDNIDPWGHIKGFANITKILKTGGIFYFSVPMGLQRIDFNAHRIFNLNYLIKWVSRDFNINTFSYVDDNGDFHEDIQLSDELISINCNCHHGCAIFVLSKK